MVIADNIGIASSSSAQTHGRNTISACADGWPSKRWAAPEAPVPLSHRTMGTQTGHSLSVLTKRRSESEGSGGLAKRLINSYPSVSPAFCVAES